MHSIPMSTSTEEPKNGAYKTVKPNEILLQVKTLENLKRSFREKTVNMKKPPSFVHVVDSENPQQENEKEKKKKKTPKKGDTKKQFFVNFMAEVIGTALLMFLGCMGCTPQADNPPAVHHMSSLSFGLVVLLIIQIFGHVSGAHLNPAVTISTVIFKMLSPAMGAVYIVAQFLGAIFGFALLRILLPAPWVVPGFCFTKPHADSTAMQCLAIELIITCTLILVCCGVWDKRNEAKQDSVPARFGFIICAISMVAGPITGASMNTARSFAPAFWEGNYTDQWIYWVGPNAGAILGCGIYAYLFAYKEEQEDEGTELEEVNQMITEKS